MERKRRRPAVPVAVPAPAWDQDKNGVDLTLLRENLERTPTERVRRADRARRDALRLLEHGRRHREERP